MGILFDSMCPAQHVLGDLRSGDTFIVENKGRPYTDEVEADDVYMVINVRHYCISGKNGNTANIVNLRKGTIHGWRRNLPIRKVKVTAQVEA